jgi:hypothetical protein
MSRFCRVPPFLADADCICQEIALLKEWEHDAGNSFAHIVLGDYNLSDRSIIFCLDQNRVDDWVRQKTRDYYRRPIPDPDNLEEWEKQGYWDILEKRDEIIILLRWLLHTREGERDKVSN